MDVEKVPKQRWKLVSHDSYHPVGSQTDAFATELLYMQPEDRRMHPVRQQELLRRVSRILRPESEAVP